ncbi:hypothetical protein LUZ62_033756 [Rhynchospora pubera]|uniref:Uncharacterized protein n=1 Tax=Rhynchospora pubera TaxID=906938 RepID=A0AAV8HYI9_9POAL|nr:hypothetical protein LUZ62_078824 [Rhynchospora pubera]KAJ4821190.1 hypothetical protein LUZ62_033756 [Rhynchospora pubera]
MEEFQEEDIFWPEDDQDQEEDSMGFDVHSTNIRARNGTSAPIPIPSKGPVSHSWTAGFNYHGHGINMQDDDHDDDGEDYNGVAAGAGTLSRSMVPPHILVSRRYAEKMPFSVCVGNGRKLKGREQRAMRTSVLRLTGYLEK